MPLRLPGLGISTPISDLPLGQGEEGMTKDKLISYLKGCARLGRSEDGVAFVRSDLLEEAIELISGERQPNCDTPECPNCAGKVAKL